MTDYTPYKELYLKCFTEDTKEDADFLFENVLSKATLISKEYEGRPIAMLFLMESSLTEKDKTYPFYYLYAACTHPNFRGKGIMGELLKCAKKTALSKGKLGIFLKPATKSLFDFYEKYGFNSFFDYSFLLLSYSDLSNLNFTETDYEFLSLEDWHLLRKEWLPHLCDIYADFSKSLFLGATDGLTVAKTENAAAVFEIRGNTLLIKEALCLNQDYRALLNLCFTLAKRQGAEKLELRMPKAINSKGFENLPLTSSPFSVIWCCDNFPLNKFENAYHGFAFD